MEHYIVNVYIEKQMNQELIDNKMLEMGFKKTDYKICDFCEDPKDGMFVRISGYEYHDDWYTICGCCMASISCRFPFLHDIELGTKISELQSKLRVKLPF